MKIKYLLWAFLFCCGVAFHSEAQINNPFKNLEIITTLQRPPDNAAVSAQIKDIQLLAEKSGIVFTADKLFRTDDNGESWREINLPRLTNEKISGVSFLNETIGWTVLSDEKNARLSIAKTTDGGNSWIRNTLNLRTQDLTETRFDTVSFEFADEFSANLTLQLQSSSNFVREAIYKTEDGGKSWYFLSDRIKKKENDTEVIGNIVAKDGLWTLTSGGNCEGFKTDCYQETKVFIQQKEITPPQIKELSKSEKENAKFKAQRFIFSQPPNGNTRISLSRGFDKCTAATAAQMQTWWDNSPFYDANIYISGRNRGCSQPQLTAAWVDTVSAQGWGLIPTIVGYQSPCVASTSNLAKHSSDPLVAEQQGRGEADIAIADANALGLTQGTVLYYDMERYDDTSGTGACSTPTKAFLKGWTDRLKELGYISGVYGSPTNAVNDWLSIPLASRMDAVWLARWDNVPSVWTYASPSPVVPESVWANHQRIKQWQAPHNETWGGVTFNIDGNIADAPVAGIAITKNKKADFDGDGRTDISVWRPDSGVWYISNSSNSSFRIQNFGIVSDRLTPGDYDGDGKTDLAVWRPSDGSWHIYSRSIYRSVFFGTNGDIPVPADYDGDGRTDIAVFRPSSGVWYIWNSFDSRGTSFTIRQFGLNGDKPVTGDYDGDGKADLAVWRPVEGVWYLMQSSQGFAAVSFGISTDVAAQGDYDGDGKTDLGIYRDGVWYLYQSQAGIRVVQFGISGDLPATGDYDGDNKDDLAVFRSSEGIWYLLQSQAGFAAAQFGINGDKPIPNAYLP